MRNRLGAVVSMVTIAWAAVAHGATFTDSGSFLAVATATNLETFESSANGETSFSDFSVSSPGALESYRGYDIAGSSSDQWSELFEWGIATAGFLNV